MKAIITLFVAILPMVLWAYSVADAFDRNVQLGWSSYEWVLVGGVTLCTVMVAVLGFATALRRR